MKNKLNKLKNKKNAGIWGMITLASVLVLTTLFVIDNEKAKIEEKGPVIETVYVGVKDEKELDNFNRESAVKKLQDILVEVGKDPSAQTEGVANAEPAKKSDVDSKEKESSDNKAKEKDAAKKEKADSAERTAKDSTEAKKVDESKSDEKADSINKRLELLNNEETDIEDVLTKDAIDMLYMAEEFGGEKFNRQFAASSLLIYHDIILDSSETDDFKPVIQSYDEIVYLDNKLMTAHIPLDIFVGTGSGIAFEMQYIDGEWKLNPYTAMMSLNLMGILNNTDETTKVAE